MTVVVDNPNLERLWTLLSELSAQLTANREQCATLQKQAAELKSQAVHTNIGFALRRFNVDITQEKFESELERQNVALVLENQQLHYENKQLSALLKDYEITLESVMGKFRSLAASTQQHELALHRHYESLLFSCMQQQQTPPSPPYNPSNISPYDRDPSKLHSKTSIDQPFYNSPTSSHLYESPTGAHQRGERGASLTSVSGSTSSATLPPEMQQSLERISSLLTKSLKALDGEDDDPEDAPSPVPSSVSSQGGHSPRHSLKMPIEIQHLNQAQLGYIGQTGVLTKYDAALEMESERWRLEKENQELRKLLGIESDTISSTVAASISIPASTPSPSADVTEFFNNNKSPKMNGVGGGRQTSLLGLDLDPSDLPTGNEWNNDFKPIGSLSSLSALPMSMSNSRSMGRDESSLLASPLALNNPHLVKEHANEHEEVEEDMQPLDADALMDSLGDEEGRMGDIKDEDEM